MSTRSNLIRCPLAVGLAIALLHELQRNVLLDARVHRQEHDRHSAMTNLPENFVRPDLLEHGGHRVTNQLSRASTSCAARSSQEKTAGVIPTKTLLVKTGEA